MLDVLLKNLNVDSSTINYQQVEKDLSELVLQTNIVCDPYFDQNNVNLFKMNYPGTDDLQLEQLYAELINLFTIKLQDAFEKDLSEFLYRKEDAFVLQSIKQKLTDKIYKVGYRDFNDLFYMFWRGRTDLSELSV